MEEQTNQEVNEQVKDTNNTFMILMVIVLGIIGLIVAGVLSYKYSDYEDKQQTRIDNAKTEAIIQVVNSISQTGEIPYFDNSSGSMELKVISINDLCRMTG
jgi:heme/copper-type cytochrome/quinol oxidase subunit 2